MTQSLTDNLSSQPNDLPQGEQIAPSHHHRGGLAVSMEMRLDSDEQIEALAEILIEAYRACNQKK